MTLKDTKILKKYCSYFSAQILSVAFCNLSDFHRWYKTKVGTSVDDILVLCQFITSLVKIKLKKSFLLWPVTYLSSECTLRQILSV